MALKEEVEELENRPMIFDVLFCEEEIFEEDLEGNEFEEEGGLQNCDKTPRNQLFLSSHLLENDLFWDDNELELLILKEKETHFRYGHIVSDGSLMVSRNKALDWFFGVKSHFGFSTLTVVLAVNYCDRFISTQWFQKDKPWMSQLLAVACLSLAAKVEEIQVPLLLDLQVEESKYLFEAKTIQRMELLILSTLQWRMHPVTPIDFFDHVTRRLGLTTCLHWEFLLRCKQAILSVIADCRFMCYLPSILATATMLHVIREIEPYNFLEHRNELMVELKTNETSVNECYKLIADLLGTECYGQPESNKRKHISVPYTPNGAIDASFSCDTLNGSWAVGLSVLSSPHPQLKRSKVFDQKMRLPSTCETVDVLGRLR